MPSAALNDALPGLDWLRITDRKSGAIKLTPLDAQPEPRNLRRLKRAVRDRWGQVPLIDMVTEAALRTGMLGHLTAIGTREGLERPVLWERLLLLAYAYGTNTGISAVAAGGHGHSEADLRYTARRYFTIDGARAVAIQLANATFAARQSEIWGQCTTTVASDSTHFRAYDQNLFTEWHSRYGVRGVLIYWHIEKKSMVVHSQLLSCAASEVAAMVEGAVRHVTSMQLEGSEFATNRRDQQQLGMLSLHILQAALVYVNTLMIQDILAEPEWAGVLTPEDLRGLTPLFWAHVLPYGEVKLNMTRRIALNAAQTARPTPSRPPSGVAARSRAGAPGARSA